MQKREGKKETRRRNEDDKLIHGEVCRPGASFMNSFCPVLQPPPTKDHQDINEDYC